MFNSGGGTALVGFGSFVVVCVVVLLVATLELPARPRPLAAQVVVLRGEESRRHVNVRGLVAQTQPALEGGGGQVWCPRGCLRPWVPFNHITPNYEEIYEKLVPHNGNNPYFTKNADLDAVDSRIKKDTGLSVKELARFPCRLFTLIDLVEWNATYGFLNCDRLLALYPKDPEIEFTRVALGIDDYVYGDKAHAADPHWGDLHFPVTAPHTGAYDLVLFAQTLEHLYDPVLCLRNMYDAMAPGGYIFTSVPMLNHLHMGATFFSMATPTGLGVWMTTAGFEVLRIGVFGNAKYMESLSKDVTWWQKWQYYYNASGRPQIINDYMRPVQTWVLARKPVGPRV